MIYIGLILVVVNNYPEKSQNEQDAQAPEPSSMKQDKPSSSTTILEDAGRMGFVVRCPACFWENTYPDKTRALKALGAHKRKCSRKDVRVSPFALPFKPKK